MGRQRVQLGFRPVPDCGGAGLWRRCRELVQCRARGGRSLVSILPIGDRLGCDGLGGRRSGIAAIWPKPHSLGHGDADAGLRRRRSHGTCRGTCRHFRADFGCSSLPRLCDCRRSHGSFPDRWDLLPPTTSRMTSSHLEGIWAGRKSCQCDREIRNGGLKRSET